MCHGLGGSAPRAGAEAWPLARLQLLLLEVELPTSLFIALVVWGYLVPAGGGNPFPDAARGLGGDPLLSPDYLTVHGLNALLLLLELGFNRLALRPAHAALVCWWPSLYLVFQLGSGPAEGDAAIRGAHRSPPHVLKYAYQRCILARS